MSDIDHLENRAGPAQRGPDHQRSLCACTVPRVKHHENNVFLCAKCGHRLNTDNYGDAYRRWPGDLAAAAQHENRLGLVQLLPEAVQQKLMAIPDDRTFARAAAREVRKYQAIKEYDADHERRLGPNEKRRLERRYDAVVEQINEASDDPGLTKLQQLFDAVRAHQHRPEPEIVSRAEYNRRRAEQE